jgi:hypothetical protein
MCLYPNCEADTPYLPSFDRPPYPLYGHVLAGTATDEKETPPNRIECPKMALYPHKALLPHKAYVSVYTGIIYAIVHSVILTYYTIAYAIYRTEGGIAARRRLTVPARSIPSNSRSNIPIAVLKSSIATSPDL